MASRSPTLSSRDAKLAMKTARMSPFSQRETIQQQQKAVAEEPTRNSHLPVTLLTFSVLSVGIFGLLCVNMNTPTMTEMPKRLIYILRMHTFGILPLAAGILCSMFTQATSFGPLQSYYQSICQFALLVITNIILSSFEHGHCQLIAICLAIWIVGRFLALASSCSVNLCQTIATATSVFPILLVIALALYCLWQHGLECDLDQLTIPKEESEEEARGFFF